MLDDVWRDVGNPIVMRFFDIDLRGCDPFHSG